MHDIYKIPERLLKAKLSLKHMLSYCRILISNLKNYLHAVKCLLDVNIQVRMLSSSNVHDIFFDSEKFKLVS